MIQYNFGQCLATSNGAHGQPYLDYGTNSREVSARSIPGTTTAAIADLRQMGRPHCASTIRKTPRETRRVATTRWSTATAMPTSSRFAREHPAAATATVRIRVHRRCQRHGYDQQQLHCVRQSAVLSCPASRLWRHQHGLDGECQHAERQALQCLCRVVLSGLLSSSQRGRRANGPG